MQREARQHVEEVDVARGRPMTFIWPKPRLCALCLEASSIGRSLEASSRPRIAAKCMHSFRRLHSFPRNLGTKTSADWGRGVESRLKRPSLGKRSGRGVRVPPTVGPVAAMPKKVTAPSTSAGGRGPRYKEGATTPSGRGGNAQRWNAQAAQAACRQLLVDLQVVQSIANA